MTEKLAYVLTSLAEAQRDDQKVVLERAQRELINRLGALVGPLIHMDAAPCRGYWVRAVRQWQRDTGIPIASVDSLPKEERMAAARQIAMNFKEIVCAALAHEDQVKALEAAVDAAIQLHAKEFAGR